MRRRAASSWRPPLPALLFPALIWGCLALSRAAAAPNKSGVGPGAISLPSGPGSIEGLGDNFEVQLNTGTANFGFGVVLPPGRAGLQPTVKVTYDTGAGNGLAGLGWNFGFASIKREAEKGFPAFNSGDTFVFGGEELAPLSNPEQDWRCKNERSFQRIRQIPSLNAWEVTDPNGTRHILGQYRGEGGRFSAVMNPNAVQSATFDQTYLWAENTAIDVHGNRIEYEYEAGQGMLYPSRITYAHWPDPTNPALTNYHEVSFIYEGRPDVFDDFRPTFALTTDRRLRRIEVASFYDGSRHLVRAYELDYAYQPQDLAPLPEDGSADLGVSLLKRVVQYGSDGNTNNYLPPLLLSYSSFNLSRSRLQSIPAPVTELNEVNGNVQLVDIDGDGLPDLFQTTEFDQRFQLNLGELPPPGGGDPVLQFSDLIIQPRAADMSLQDPQSSLADLNGDGLVDYFHLVPGDFGSLELHSFPNLSTLDHTDPTPPGFSQYEEVQYDLPYGISFTNAAVRQMDVNFDKRTDFVISEPGFFGQFRFIYRDSEDNWQEILTPYPDDMPGALTFAWNGGDGGGHAVYLADMNGDRLPDVVLVQVDGPDLVVRYWPYTGLGTFGASHTMTVAPPDELALQTGDLRDLYVQDFTGDGLADLLMVDGSGEPSRIVFRANVAGTTWTAPYERDDLPRYAPRDAGSPTTFRTADLNGNGSVDLIWINPGLVPGWQWLDLHPQGKPNLLIQSDNNLGKITSITYGTTTEDLLRARTNGYPWQTKVPFPVQVIRRLRVTAGYDLDGVSDLGRSISTDQYVSDFAYRDAYYDSFEKQFRGFAFAQKVDYGDDTLLSTNLLTVELSPGWDQTRTPTGQVQDPTLVSRLRYHTGAPDGVDNDEYPQGFNGPRYVDEITPLGGHEEEPLKGLLLWQEAVDPWALYDPSGLADFDRGCWLALTSTNAADRGRMTSDDYVYQRTVSEFTVRRLYRSDFPLEFTALVDGAQQTITNVLTPPGRFSGYPVPVTVLPQSGLTVSYAFESRRTTTVPEANGILATALNYPPRTPVTTEVDYDHDDYGNQILEKTLGILSTNDFGDHRIVTTQYALGGQALDNWLIRLVAQADCTDLNGVFVSRRRDYYDGDPYTGLPLGQVGDRGLLHRMEGFINGDTVPPDLSQISSFPGDPRLPAGATVNVQRKAYDASGNLIAVLDPLAVLPNLDSGHVQRVSYDSRFNLYASEERLAVGGGNPDLVFSASYDPGIGAVTTAVDYAGVAVHYYYDSFNRLVAIVHPGDTLELPTVSYSYLPGDPTRSRVYRYDNGGNLTLGVEVGAASRIVSRQRLVSGATNVYVSLKYLDGLKRTLATVGEGDTPGHWLVLSAVGMGRRGRSVEDWLPFDLEYGASHDDFPPFAGIMTPASRPPLADVAGRPIFSTSLYLDPMGRTIRKVEAPDAFPGGDGQVVRRHSESWYLPFEKQLFDPNDTSVGSASAGTPRITRTDGLGRMTEMVEAAHLDDVGNVTPDVRFWTTRFAYDLNQNLTQVTDSQGNVKWFRYDGLSRKIYLQDPDRGAFTSTYDDASNQTETVDAKGQTLVATFDGLNRLLTEDYLDDQSSEFSYGRHPDVIYHYDAPAGPLAAGDGTMFQGAYTASRMAWVEDATGETHLSYDQRGRVVGTLKRVYDWETPAAADGSRPLIPFLTTLGFDAFGRIASRTFPDNDEIRQEFGPRNAVSRMFGDLAGTILSIDGRFPNGKPRQSTTGDGAVTTFAEDPRFRLTRLTTKAVLGGGTNEMVDFAYDYDALTAITRVTDLRSAAVHASGDAQRNTQVFQYDDLYRLTQASYNFGLPGETNRDDGYVSYRYDRIGNLLSQQSGITQQELGQTVTQLGDLEYGGKAGRFNRVGKGTEPGPHALTRDAARSDNLTYDADGNVTQQSGQSYTWDFNDRLVRTETAEAISESRYDFTGRRIIHKVTNKGDGTSTVTLYPTPEFEIRPNDEPVKYVFSGTTRVARVTSALSSRPRVQRLRLQAGWNLATLSVTATNITAQLATAGAAPGELVRYLGEAEGYASVNPGDSLPAGTIVWVHSDAPMVVSVVGAYAEPGSQVFPGAGFVGNPSLHAWTPPFLGQTNAEAWFFEPDRQLWLPPPVGGSNSPVLGAVVVAPGAVLYASTGAPQTLTWPEDPRGILYYHDDHLGSASVLTDRQGNILEETTYYAFGLPRTHRTVDGRSDPYGFSQKERDPETGLNYFEARYQSPVYGRFISVDPKLSLDPAANLGGPQGLNFYAYCANNPQAFVDPNGENFIGDAYDSVRDTIRETIAEVRQLVSEARDAGSGEYAGSRGRFDAMIGLWFGDKDYISLFLEHHTILDLNHDKDGNVTGTVTDKGIAGAIALDGRFVKAYELYSVTTAEGPAKPPSGIAYESKTSYGKPKIDTLTATQPAATGITGGTGVKMKRGFDYKLLGKEPSMDANGRLSADIGIGITGGVEGSMAAGNFEVSGKVNGTLTMRLVKKDNLMSVVVTGTGYAEIQGLIKFPQTGNLLQIPIRLSAEGTINYVYTFDVDKVKQLKGL